MKRTITAILIGATLLASPITTEGRSLLAHCRQIRKQEKLVRVLDGKNLANDAVWRTIDGNGDLVIEIDYGVVLNSRGDGRLLNTTDKGHNYISYRRVKGARKGDIVMSVFILPPDRKAWDDIAERYDFIIDRRR